MKSWLSFTHEWVDSFQICVEWGARAWLQALSSQERTKKLCLGRSRRCSLALRSNGFEKLELFGFRLDLRKSQEERLRRKSDSVVVGARKSTWVWRTKRGVLLSERWSLLEDQHPPHHYCIRFRSGELLILPMLLLKSFIKRLLQWISIRTIVSSNEMAVMRAARTKMLDDNKEYGEIPVHCTHYKWISDNGVSALRNNKMFFVIIFWATRSLGKKYHLTCYSEMSNSKLNLSFL